MLPAAEEGTGAMTNGDAEAGKIHVHIKNNRAGETVFRVTPERFAAACARHPEVARRIDATIDLDLDNFEDSIAEAEALLTWDFPTEHLAERAPKLKWIHVIGAGVEHLQPLDWLPPGVSLINNRGVHAQKAGEYGLMALLMLNNGLPKLMTCQREKVFAELFTGSIAGKTLLVIGLGEMGRAVARQARKLDLEVIGVRRHGEPSPDADAVHGPEAIDRLLPAADFVLVTTPATPETRGLLDRRRLGLMQPTASLINMSRAAVVDYGALADKLREGSLSGAVLDVFDPEPLPAESPLWEVPNLVMTPHVSSDDLEAYIPLTLDLFFDNLARHLEGAALRNVVRPDLGY